jgi:phosphatidylglycerophosphate synthase
MTAIQNGDFDWLWWLCLVIVIGLVVAGIWAAYTLGGLPGRIAARRGHPQATAIGVCGWLGLLVFVLWPIALVWAYTSPKGGQILATREDLDALLADLRRTSERLATIEAGLGTTTPRRIA